jgi:hypothetical protein
LLRFRLSVAAGSSLPPRASSSLVTAVSPPISAWGFPRSVAASSTLDEIVIGDSAENFNPASSVVIGRAAVQS